MNTLIVKSNILIEASINLSLVEARLLDIVFAQATRDYEADEKFFIENTTFEVTAHQYMNMYNVDSDTAYVSLKQATERLFGRYFSYYVENEDYPSMLSVHKSRWVQDIGYNDQLGKVSVMLTSNVAEFVGKLHECFTQYSLTEKSNLTSGYSFRLYEILAQWRVAKKFTITIRELRDRFGLLDEQYSTMSNFKRVVLEPAIKQINERTDLNVSYVQNKVGKQIASLTFTVHEKNPSKIITTAKRDTQTIDFIDDLTDSELQTVTAHAESYIAKNGITDPKHKANIYQKAKSEKWGIAPETPPTPNPLKDKPAGELIADLPKNIKFKGVN